MIPALDIDMDGNITTLYNDDINLYALGVIRNVRMASYIVFNETAQVWNVCDARTNTILHSNKNRARAIEWEISEFAPGGPRYEDPI